MIDDATNPAVRIAELEQRVTVERMRADGIEGDYRAVEQALRRERRATQALQQELERVREEDPGADDVKAVCTHWKTACGHQRAKTPISGVRAKAVRGRLKDGHTTAELKQAIDGYAKAPFVVNAERVAHGQRHQRYDDLELICRNEKTVAKGIELATARPPLGDVWSERVEHMMYRAVDAVRELEAKNALLRELLRAYRDLDLHLPDELAERRAAREAA